MSKAGRPTLYKPETVVRLAPSDPKSKLQTGSERRAIINFIVDHQGSVTMAQLDTHFGFETKSRVAALVYAGWLEVD